MSAVILSELTRRTRRPPANRGESGSRFGLPLLFADYLLNLVTRWTLPTLAALALTIVGPCQAQDGVGRVFPNGARPGETVTLTFPMMNEEPTAVLVVDGPGVKPVGPFVKGVGQVEIAADAQPGMRQIRLVGAKKATTPRPFLIDPTPSLLDVEVADKKSANDRLAQAQQIAALPVVLSGSLAKPQDIDVYRVLLKKGDCLVAASESRRIAAPTNLGVYLRDLQGRKLPLELDYRKRDPLYWCVIPADGEYQLQLFEVTNNMGDVGEHTLYRLHVTTGPWLGFVTPPGGRRGASARLTAYGWNFGGKPGPGSAPVDLPIPADAGAAIFVSAAGAGNHVTLAVGDLPETAETEPNNAADRAQPLSLPMTLNGEFQVRGDVDCYRVSLVNGERIRIQVQARELESNADVIVRVLDGSGKTLVLEDDMQASRDPELFWTARADGVYTIEVREIASGSRSGPAFYYRLNVSQTAPQLRAVAKEAVLTLKPGARVDVPITVFQDFQSGEVTLEAEGLPEGVTAESARVKAAPDRSTATATKLVLTATAGARPGFGLFRVIVKTAAGTPRPQAATWALTGDGGWTYGTGSVDRLVALIPAP
ncbi:MAG: PPC domain-containing protein [Actinomycetota bacterium]